jgi:uncharacterized Zn finger protein
MATFTFTKDDILRNCDRKSYARGEEYYENGAVTSLVRRGNTVTADVEGSMDDYVVTATFQGDGEIEADCDCPYEYGGWCKHIVAVMLTCLHDSEDVEEQPTLETLLEPLDRAALQTLLLKLASQNPSLANEIAIAAESFQIRALASDSSPVSSATPTAPPAIPSVNADAIRRRTKTALKTVNYGGYDYYGEEEVDSGTLDEEVLEILSEAETRIQAGDGRGAMLVLEAVTDELAKGWRRIEEMLGGYDSDLCDDLGRVWAEATLTQELTTAERQTWKTRLREWQKKADGSGLDDSVETALYAVEQGWDYPPLLRVLQGEITDKGAWEDESPDVVDTLAIARLNVLERQGRLQDAIYLAEAEGQFNRFVELLVKAGRADEAVQQGIQYFTQADEALILAKVLNEAGEPAKALQIAEHGLTIQPETQNPSFYGYTHRGAKKPLADWLRDYAWTQGNTALAIKAAMAGIEEQPSLKDYKRLKEISGDQWEALREKILSHVTEFKGYDKKGPVDILLHEERNGAALKIAIASGDSLLLARVVDKAVKTHPAEVIAPCRKQAEDIMDNKKVQLYEEAARWMERIREAYRALDQMGEWQNYKEQTITKHQKKYKLVPLLLPL